MQKIILVASLSFLLFCGYSHAQDKTYHIAYNIHVPDTSKDDWEVMVMNMNGTDKKNISNHKDVAWTYYAYKKKLYLISDRDTAYRNYFLYETDVRGSYFRKVTDLRLEDSWMSSRNQGTEMVVTGRIGKEIRHQLFLINLQTGAWKQITNDTAARYGDPCFSPDGKQIVFYYKKDKRNRNLHEELYIMNIDGSGMRRLTNYPEDNISAKGFGYKAGSPRWHPTENFISYVSMQDGRNSIFAITPDGSRQWKLTSNTQGEGWHDWSPDGKWLVYNSSDIEEKQYHITLMNWKTKVQKQLTDNSYKSQQAPVFVEP